MSNDRKFGGLVGVLGASMAVCCGLPVLLGTGIAVGAAGLALGSGLVVAAGAVLGVWGWRRRRGARDCEVPHSELDERHPASLTRSEEHPGPDDALYPDDRGLRTPFSKA